MLKDQGSAKTRVQMLALTWLLLKFLSRSWLQSHVCRQKARLLLDFWRIQHCTCALNSLVFPKLHSWVFSWWSSDILMGWLCWQMPGNLLNIGLGAWVWAWERSVRTQLHEIFPCKQVNHNIAYSRAVWNLEFFGGGGWAVPVCILPDFGATRSVLCINALKRLSSNFFWYTSKQNGKDHQHCLITVLTRTWFFKE